MNERFIFGSTEHAGRPPGRPGKPQISPSQTDLAEEPTGRLHPRSHFCLSVALTPDLVGAPDDLGIPGERVSEGLILIRPQHQ